MRRALIPFVLVASSFWLNTGYSERYCATAGGHAGYDSCSFPSLEACRTYVSGVGGFCRPNPMAVEEPVRAPRKKARRQHS